MEKLRAVIFDLDGTIGDTLPLCIKAFRNAIEPLTGRTVSDAEIIDTFGPSEEGTIRALAPGSFEQGLKDYLHYYEKFHAMCPSPFAGMKELLSGLKSRKVHLAMVTGKGPVSTAISLKQFGLENYFEIVETGSPGGPRKTEGIRSVLNYFANPGKDAVIYVGDATGDIIAAKKAGVPVVAAAWAGTSEPGKLEALQPNEIFHTIADFQNWLTRRI